MKEFHITTRRGQKLALAVAVSADVPRHICNRKRELRIEPVKYGRAVLDDTVGIRDLREITGVDDCRADEFRKSVERVDFDCGPCAVSLAITDTNGSPPIPAREHRNQEKRLDTARIKETPDRLVSLIRADELHFPLREISRHGNRAFGSSGLPEIAPIDYRRRAWRIPHMAYEESEVCSVIVRV